jgi:shikimate dehydrogenase
MTRMLVGLLGIDIGGSLAPALHDDAFAASGMAGHYHLMDAKRPERRLDELFAAVRLAGFGGVNVTFPFKEAVIPLLDDVSAEAREIGAVNTVVFDERGHATGHNTDRLGFRGAFREELGEDSVRGKPVLLLGAGGAGRAVAFALMDLGASLVRLHDVDLKRAEGLCSDLVKRFGAGRCEVERNPQAAVASAAVVVNATPIGMKGHAGLPMPTDDITSRHVVADVIYTPIETAFLGAARAQGARGMGGAGMCVHQAVEAFRLFTGRVPDVTRMKQTFAEACARRDASLSKG